MTFSVANSAGMKIDEIKELYHAASFFPSDIVLTDGSAVHAAHSEFMAFSPRWDTIYVSQADGLKRIDLKFAIASKADDRLKKTHRTK